MDEHKENSFVFDESSLNGDVCPNVLRMAHIKESLACHEEAQRLQRMCRDLKVNLHKCWVALLKLLMQFS